MKIVTINIPDQYLDCIEVLVQLGYYPSRSEAVRQALIFFIKNEQQFSNDINPKEFCNQKIKQSEGVLCE